MNRRFKIFIDKGEEEAENKRMEFKRIVNLSLSGAKGLFLFGPRQTGKSYWLRKKFPKAAYYDLLMSDIFLRFSRSPHLLREELLAQKPKSPVIIDEIQKMPILLDEVHFLMERHNMKFILTGSSARKLKRGGANMLGGRALRRLMLPLTFREIPHFDLAKALQFGSMPAIYKAREPRPLLRSYAQTYLKEEILAEGLTRRLQPFSLFLKLSGQTNAELINYSNIASDTGVSSHTIKEYYAILEDTFMGRMLPPYQKTSKRKAVSMNKFYFFDIGAASALADQWSAEKGSFEYGRRFEHFIFNEIKAFLEYTQDSRPMRFWRSKSQHEVDFVIGDNLAIEAKASHEVRKRDLKGLRALCEEIPFQSKLVVSLEKKPRLLEDGILILPWRDFLKKLWRKEFS